MMNWLARHLTDDYTGRAVRSAQSHQSHSSNVAGKLDMLPVILKLIFVEEMQQT